MLCPGALRVVALIALSIAVPGSVAATSCAPPDEVRRGFLGGDRYGLETLEVPRNVAVLNARINQTNPWRPVPLVRMAIDGLWRPKTLLASNIEIESVTDNTSRGRMAVTTREIDFQPPTPVELLGVFRGGCVGSLKVDLEELPSDDQTPADQLVYAVYEGSTAEEAEASPQPVGLWRGSYLKIRAQREWVAISVLDHAGNESPRSKAIEVVSPPSTSTCAASAAKPNTSPATVLALLLGAWAGARTIRRRL